MKKLVATSLFTLALLAGLPATGSAEGKSTSASRISPASRGDQVGDARWRKWYRVKGKPAAAVPELDPGAAAQALALLLAGTAVFMRRRSARA